MGFSLIDYMVGKDVYGHPVGINYRGSDSFQTKMGALCTLATLIVVIVNSTSLGKAFFDGSKQDEKVSTTVQDLFETEDYVFGE